MSDLRQLLREGLDAPTAPIPSLKDLKKRATSRTRQRAAALSAAGLFGLGGVTAVVVGTEGTTSSHRVDSAGNPTMVTGPGYDSSNQDEAAQLLRSVTLPNGATETRTFLSAGLEMPPTSLGVGGTTDEYRLWIVPERSTDIATFLRAHLPAGMRLTVTSGEASSGSTPQVLVDAFAPKVLPPGVFAAQVTEQVFAVGNGQSEVRIDAQVAPQRELKPQEQIAAIGITGVSVDQYSTAPTRSVTVTAGSAISSIVTEWNSLPAIPALTCNGPVPVAYRIEFLSAVGGGYNVVATTDDCGNWTVTVDGQVAPSKKGSDQLLNTLNSLFSP